MSRGVESEIVGRDEELATLAQLLDRARDEATGCVIEGDPGMGKTALWSWAVAAASERDCHVVIARPAEAEASFSFAALGDLLRGDLGEVARQLPPLQRRALEAALLVGDGDGAPVDPHAVAVAAVSTLELLAKTQPVVIAVDDVQWLDAASAAVLRFVARRLPRRVFLLVAERVEGGRAEFPVDGERLRVGPLSVGALHRLIQQRLQLSLPRPTLLRLHEATGGNALYALEFARTLADADVELGAGDPLPVPGTLHDVVAQRLETISPETRAALLRVAASSRPTAELLPRPALEEARRTGVVVQEGARLRFTHPLFASILYGDAAPADRREVHAQLAREVEDVEEAARHLALSTNPPDEAVARRLEEAASRARARGAPTAGADLMEQAAAMTPASDAETRLRRIVDAAELHFDARSDRSVESLLEAELQELRGDLRARALRMLAWHRHVNQEGAGLALSYEALEHVEDPRLELQIRLDLVNPPMAPLRVENPRAHAERAVELAEQLGEPTLLATALASRAHLDEGESPDLFRAVEIEQQARSGVIARIVLARRRLMVGAAAEACDILRAAAEDGRAAGTRTEAWALSWLATTEAMAGSPRQSKLSADRLYDLVSPELPLLGKLAVHAERALAAAFLGDADAARRDADAAIQLADAAGFAGRSMHSRWIRGFVDLSTDDPTSAAEYFVDALRHLPTVPEERWPPGHMSILALPWLGADATLAFAELGRPEAATPFLDKLHEYEAPTDRFRAAASYCQGVVAVADGDEDRAIAELTTAVELLERMSLPFDLARGLLALGTAQRRALQRGDARTSLQRALEIFERIETPLWAAKARAELGRVGGRTASGALTASEQRVAELVAAGKTNKEVAAELFVTPRTVEATLTRIYGKLGIRSRTELARRLAEPTSV